MKKKNKRKRIIKKRLLIVILIISFLMISFSTINVLSWIKDNKNNKIITEQIQNSITIKEPSKTEDNNILVNPPENPEDAYWKYEDAEFLQINFTDLLEQNKETIGWIKVEGTEVNYPIVQADNNEYYLNHSFDNSENEAGWIFSDFRNNFQRLNTNTIIYGHARKDNTMFGSLKQTLENEWYQNEMNHIIKISTPKENTIWQIFSIYTIPNETYYLTSNFKTQSSYELFIETLIKRSIYKFETTVNINDKILTLSTCKDTYGNRLVIHAKLIRKGTR